MLSSDSWLSCRQLLLFFTLFGKSLELQSFSYLPYSLLFPTFQSLVLCIMSDMHNTQCIQRASEPLKAFAVKLQYGVDSPLYTRNWSLQLRLHSRMLMQWFIEMYLCRNDICSCNAQCQGCSGAFQQLLQASRLTYATIAFKMALQLCAILMKHLQILAAYLQDPHSHHAGFQNKPVTWSVITLEKINRSHLLTSESVAVSSISLLASSYQSPR